MARKGKLNLDLQLGDLIYLSSTSSRPAYIVKRSEVGEISHGSGRYVPHEIMAIWVDREPIDLGVDIEDCDIIIFEDGLWAVLHGSIRKVGAPDERNI
jgi:hypothetical protein